MTTNEVLCGQKLLGIHRVDLHNELRRLALGIANEKLPVEPATIHLGVEVIDINPETGVIEVAGGKEYRKDVVVVADGVHVRLQLYFSAAV
jgi:salicylate hydroxylase